MAQTPDIIYFEEHVKYRKITPKPYIGGFAVHFNHAFAKASKEAGSSAASLLALISRVESENQVCVRPHHLAKLLGISDKSASRHMQKLQKLHLLEPDALEEGRTYGTLFWRLCPFLVWKGDIGSLTRYLKTLEQNHPWFEYEDPKSKR